jgi:nucleotide sugar dehydrogenase
MSISKDTVCIIGVGYVGEHLVSCFIKHFNVVGYDISPQRVSALTKRYESCEKIRITDKELDIPVGAGLYCISVPTLLKINNIDDSFVKAAISTVSKYALQGSCIVMESSVSVGMTRALLGDLSKNQGIFVGFSPERVDPGRIEPPVDKIPKILSGIDDTSLEVAKSFYEKVFDNIVPVSSLETAEMCKLYENCFRVVNIAYTNEIADACKTHEVDFNEMVTASSTKPFGFMPFQAGLGVGGHCLPVNPYYLFVNCRLPLLDAAISTLNKRPLEKAREWFEENHDKYQNVCIVGMAFKRGESLCVNSPSLAFSQELAKLSLERAEEGNKIKNVYVYDPLVKNNSTHNDNVVWLKKDQWTRTFLSDNDIDAVVIAMRQMDVDYTILDEFDGVVFDGLL